MGQLTAADFYKLANEGKEETTSTPITASNFVQIAQEAPKQEGTPWSEVPVQAYANIVPSAIEFGKGIAQTVTHPLESASHIVDLMRGGLLHLIPESALDPTQATAIKKAKEAESQLKQIYADKYGSEEALKHTLSTDPVGVASDLSMLLSGGASLPGGLSKMAKVSGELNLSKALENISNVAKTGSEFTNPISAPFKAAGVVGKPLLGMATGTSAETIGGGAKAGFIGDKEFQGALRGESPMTQPLENARHNLEVMRQNRGNAYRSGMHDISKDKTVLDFKDIDNALEKARSSNRFVDKIKDDVAEQHLNELADEIKAWKNSEPTIYHTPEGIDNLKQRLGAITDRVNPQTEANSSRIGSNIYNAVKDTISKQAPVYADVMKDYAQSSEQIREIEKALSLNNKASADTALRKLQSLTRNNVNTNYGQRLSLAQQLEAEGGKPFISALHGQALSSPSARGLAGGVENLTAATGLLTNPAYLAALPFQTPRLVGEGLYYGGKAARKLSDIGKTTGLNAGSINALSNLGKIPRIEIEGVPSGQ